MGIGVDQQYPLATLGQNARQGDDRGGFTDSTLLIGNRPNNHCINPALLLCVCHHRAA